MFPVLRSIAVIGTIFALSPVREEARAPASPAPPPARDALLPGAMLPDAAQAWEALPPGARQALAGEVARLLSEAASGVAAPPAPR